MPCACVTFNQKPPPNFGTDTPTCNTHLVHIVHVKVSLATVAYSFVPCPWVIWLRGIAAPGAVEIIAHTKLLTQVRKVRVVAISPFFLAAWIN